MKERAQAARILSTSSGWTVNWSAGICVFVELWNDREASVEVVLILTHPTIEFTSRTSDSEMETAFKRSIVIWKKPGIMKFP